MQPGLNFTFKRFIVLLPMDVNAYINSGKLEQYCLEAYNTELGNEIAGLCTLYPEIKQELTALEIAFEQLAKSQAIAPNPQIKDRIFAAIDFSDEVISLDNLPPTNKYSGYKSWLKAVEHLIPAEPFEDFFMEVLRQDEQIAQMLVVTKLNVPEEVHEVVAESFFILKGTCICKVGNQFYTLNAGDYLDIPLHTTHDIKIVSPYVVAILQNQFA